ncbi:MAG: creatininase family protein [Deltaproteobacteria bacterium]|nr:creatininase family protein [Deltaproteobacteria bacterium]
MRLDEMTMVEFKGRLKGTKTLIVPFGTVEAHGSHLPLSTDSLIIREVVRSASEKTGAFAAPELAYGVCTSTGPHPGTLGITPDTLRMLIRDIVRHGASKGIKNFILISGHGGGIHVSAMREAAESLTREIKGIRLAALSIYELVGKEILDTAETKNDSHAGEIETSLVLYLAPGLVKGRAREGYPDTASPIIARDKLRRWKGAVWGNPEKASVEKGKKIFDAMVRRTVELVRRIEDARP